MVHIQEIGRKGYGMKFFQQWGDFMMAGARSWASWELDVSNAILRDKRRLFILVLMTMPVILGSFAFADQIGSVIRTSMNRRRLSRNMALDTSSSQLAQDLAPAIR